MFELATSFRISQSHIQLEAPFCFETNTLAQMDELGNE